MSTTLLIVLLTCSPPITADHCTRDTADDVRVLGRTAMPNECAMVGATSAAHEGNAEDGRFSVVRCERK